MNPNPNPNSIPSLTDSYFSYFSQNPNSHFALHQQLSHGYIDHSSAAAAALAPPGVGSYSTANTLPQAQAIPLVQPDSTSYYLDPNFQNWAAIEALRQYGSDPAGYGGAVSATPQEGTKQLSIALPGSAEWANWVAQLQANGAAKKRQKKTKVVQSAYCEVCKIDCNSKDVLDQHKLGKKHKKNLEILREAVAGHSNSSAPPNPFIGPQNKPNKGQTSNVQKGKMKAAGPVEDLETKRRKIVQGGAAVEAVRVCTICNVVCNSDSVYNFHLAGRKHAIMLKKHALGMVAAT